MEFINQVTKEFILKINSQKESVINEAFAKLGFVVNEEFLKDNISLVTSEKDEFEHVYYRYDSIDEQRIISFHKVPDLKFEIGMYNNVRQTFELKYY